MLKKAGLLFDNDFALKTTQPDGVFAEKVYQQFYHPAYMPFPEAAYEHGDLNLYNNS